MDTLALRGEALQLRPDVEITLLVDDDAGVGVLSGPEPEDPMRRDALLQPGDVPALDEAAGIAEVEGVSGDRDGVLDRDVGVAEIPQQLVVPSRRVEHELRPHNRLTIRQIAPVELDDVDLAVLPALEQVIAELQR